MNAAPFYADIADAPDGPSCNWITTSDGLRLRMAAWKPGPRGTVLLFPGRTEYIEKYGRTAREFADRGFAMVAVDWRGQGLSDRIHDDPHSGHVDHFPDYQADVAAIVRAARAMDTPRPFYLVAHSMGGAIGLRALYEGLDVPAVAFSAPMWGITMAAGLRPVAWSLSWAGRSLGFSNRYAPGTNGRAYVSDTGFADNLLTQDPEMWTYMHRQIEAHPDLIIGGPSLHWLHEALSETRALAARPSPDVPALTWVGDCEAIVDRTRIDARMAHWKNGTLEVIPTARHEVMMETPAIRARFFDAAAALFTANG
ncbi:alpha/beta fold hydrolase [Oceaniglobus indicus]|uniref:alpha/beta fold hydrolase n=1 Tax=Oceaniglobus indicus TaxID=2047749 RepID=UPI000C182DE0|nr:alpha/beta hydrolase [Oceaniglobus indicus]